MRRAGPCRRSSGRDACQGIRGDTEGCSQRQGAERCLFGCRRRVSELFRLPPLIGKRIYAATVLPSPKPAMYRSVTLSDRRNRLALSSTGIPARFSEKDLESSIHRRHLVRQSD
jgi:hypothetical protein